jgi:predicted lipid-binding transport protein (Tim44 family)
MATEAATSKKADKPKKGSKKDAKKAAKGATTDPSGGPSVAAHPRAARAVARAKGWGALAGFVLGGYLSLSTNTLAMAGLRALVAGLICYVAVWAGAVFIWRRLVMLEIKGRQQKLLSARESEGR